MIVKITHKEYRKAMQVRKLKIKGWEGPALYFEGDLGGYYKCTAKGGKGAKEIADFKKDQKSHLCEQLTMFDM